MTSGILQGIIAASLICWIFGIIGVLANFYVICSSFRAFLSKNGKKFRFNKIHTFLIINLAIADFFGSLYLVVIASADRYYLYYHSNIYHCYFQSYCHNVTNIWVLTPTCSFARFLANIATFLPTFLTLYIAVDRYTTVVKPHGKYRLTLDHAKILVVGAWMIALSVTIISNIRSDQLYDPHNFRIFTNVCYFTDILDPVFQIVATIGFALGILFYIATMILYIAIIVCIHRARYRISDLVVQNRSSRSRAQMRLSIITGVLAVTNFLSWFPSLVVFIGNAMRLEFLLSYIGYHLSIIAYLLLFVNSCMNPVCYTILISNHSKRLCLGKKTNSHANIVLVQ
ncbi:G-protein coupled receptor GRL101-like protein [Trichoplax sp. H2]|nr:G-protein coupled receptor GRL101-like protein [Trichoplax sp. H2]|eukprot:RDD36749.1 G-protein coupled receptor GRL101-like protein [Trichoplax sp. H2]